MRFLPESTMAFLTPLATMPCFGCLDNQNLANGEAFRTRLVRVPRGARLAASPDRLLPMLLIRPARCYGDVKIALVVFAFYLPAWNQLQGKAGL